MNSRLQLLIPVLAIIPLLVYLAFALGGVSFATNLNLLLAISIGIAALAGSVAIHKELEKTQGGTALTLGTLFLIIGFSFLVLMVTVQQAVFFALREAAALQQGARETTSYQALSLGLNYVQLGMDVAFDIFYSLGLGLVSWVMLRVPGPTRLIGMYGILAAIFLLGFNLGTFPLPPSQAGLFDVGPFTALWWLAIIAVGAFEDAKRRRDEGDT